MIDNNDYGIKSDQPSAVTWLTIQNQIQLSEAFEGWGSFHVTATAGQLDPLGGTNARLLASDGTAFASVAIGFTTTALSSIMYSVWLRADTSIQATLEIDTSLGAAMVQQIIGLDDVWRRYAIRLPLLPASTNYIARIYTGLPGSASATAIVAFGAQVNSGDEVSGYLQTIGAPLTKTIGLRLPANLDVEGDTTVGGDVAAVGNVSGFEGDFVQFVKVGPGTGTGTGFASIDLIESPTGYVARWVLSNDQQYRLQIFSAYPTTLFDTPMRIDASGKILISTIAAQGNLVVKKNVYGPFDIPSFDNSDGLFTPWRVTANTPIVADASGVPGAHKIDLANPNQVNFAGTGFAVGAGAGALTVQAYQLTANPAFFGAQANYTGLNLVTASSSTSITYVTNINFGAGTFTTATTTVVTSVSAITGVDIPGMDAGHATIRGLVIN